MSQHQLLLQVRQSAGLLLKNNLKKQYASLSDEYKQYLKVCTLNRRYVHSYTWPDMLLLPQAYLLHVSCVYMPGLPLVTAAISAPLHQKPIKAIAPDCGNKHCCHCWAGRPQLLARTSGCMRAKS